MDQQLDGMRRAGGGQHLEEFLPEAVRSVWWMARPPVGRSAKVLKTAVILIWNWNHTKIGVQQVLISAAKKENHHKNWPQKILEK